MSDIYLNSDVIEALKTDEDYTPDRRNIILLAANAGAGHIIAKSLLTIAEELAAKSKRSFIEGKDSVLWANALTTLVEIETIDNADRKRILQTIVDYKAAWHSGVPQKFIDTTASTALQRLSPRAQVTHKPQI